MKRKKIESSRRDFLKTGVAGLAGAAILPGIDVINEEKGKEAKAEEKKPAIISRTLGRTGIVLPIIGIGAQAEDPAVYRAALDRGIKHFDTANTYSGGKHEEILGEVFKGRPRDSFFVATKVHLKTDAKSGLYKEGTKVEPFLEKFNQSMKRLALDYVDILYVQALSKAGALTYKPLVELILKLQKEGRIRFIGVATHTNEPEVIRGAVDAKIYDVVLTSYNFLQPHLAEMHSAIDYAHKAGVGIIAMKTQAGVYFDKERKEPINMKAALKWAMANEKIATSVPGIANFDQLETDLSVMEDLKLTEEERKDLRLGEKVAGLYCSQCGKCESQCPAGMDIPTMMRSFMYLYGYRDIAKAHTLTDCFPKGEIPCASCGECRVKCTMGFNVRNKVMDIARLRDMPEEFFRA